MEQTKALDEILLLTHGGQQKAPVISSLVAHVDGGSLGNPGPSGIGVVIDGCPTGRIRIAKWIGYQDNNVAEYVALLEALQCCLALNATALHVYSDSQVVVKQITGEYVCRSPRLYSLHWICRKLARTIDFSIAHVSRNFNLEANRLANSAAHNQARPREFLKIHTSLDAFVSKALDIGTGHLQQPFDEG